MQKKLIALAIAGFAAAPAFAQSNVTIYGVADATFDVVKSSNSAANVSFNRVSSNSSLIGFKGAEDLGNGLKAVFQFESGVGLDSQAGLATNRDSYVGLAGGFGTVIAGNLTGPTRLVGASVDVNTGSTGIGANSGLLGKLGNALTARVDSASATGLAATPANRSATQTGAFDTRFNNAVAYVSPNFSGFTFIGGYVANENKVNNGINSSAYDLGVTYANGPLWAALTHAEYDVKNAGGLKPKNTRAAVKYDFGMADVRVIWDETKNQGTKQNVWGLGSRIKAGANGAALVQYYKANDLKGTGGVANSGANLFEVGYEHSLSKRTILKAAYARIDNKAAGTYDFGLNATGLVTAGGTDVSGIQVGLRHSF